MRRTIIRKFANHLLDTARRGVPNRARARRARWLADDLLRGGDTRFFVTYDQVEFRTVRSTPALFVVAKARSIIDGLLDLTAGRRVERILELGILQGGSAALYWELFRPARLIAIEQDPWPVTALADFAAARGVGERLRPYYGVDQADRAALGAILAREFPRRDLDLVIDDASHRYAPTKAALETILPFVRPGGLYVIEDWGWAHWPGPPWQVEDGFMPGEPSPTNLVLEMTMLCASRPDIIARVIVTHYAAYFERGPALLDGDNLDLAAHYLTRGRPFHPGL